MNTKKRTRSCLLVDDDPSILTVLVTNLEAEGFETHTADNGNDAAFLAQSLLPDLIVLDVMMPGRDGYDVLAALRADPTTSHTPVVLLTAKTSDADVWKGWTSGADYYMTKPFNVDELIHFLDNFDDPEEQADE